MHPLPDQPLPQGWVYIEHPDAGRADNPVPRSAAESVWLRHGWSIVADEPEDQSAAAGEATATPRRTRTAAAEVKE